MTRLVETKGNGIVEYICDAAADVNNLPKNSSIAAPGSTCFVIATSEVYMLGNDLVWHKI